MFGKNVEFVNCEESDEESESETTENNLQVSPEVSQDERIINLDEIENGIPPILRVVLRLTTHQTSGLFDLFATLIEKNQALPPVLAEWIFALLSAQSTPFEPSIASRMRNICKACRKLRVKLVSDESFQTSKTELNSLNLLILIISQFFDQKDLAD